MKEIEYLTKIIEVLEEVTKEKISFRIGFYEGEYYLGDDKFITIKGELYIRANHSTLFSVYDNEQLIEDNFDIIESGAKIVIDDKLRL